MEESLAVMESYFFNRGQVGDRAWYSGKGEGVLIDTVKRKVKSKGNIKGIEDVVEEYFSEVEVE